MSPELHLQFTSKMKEVIKAKQLPPEDFCRILTVLVNSCPFAPKDDDSSISLMHELLGRLRHSIYSIPKSHLAITLVNLLELQQPQIATKIAKNILLEMPGYPERIVDEFSEDQEFIELLWCLIQVEEVAQSLLPIMGRLNSIDFTKIKDMQKLVQLISISQSVFSPEELDKILDLD